MLTSDPTDSAWLDASPFAVAMAAVFVAMLAAVTYTDLERRLIPNRVLGASALAGLALVAAGDPVSLPLRALAALGAAGVLLLPALARPGAIGLGDVKLAATMGLFLGVEVVPALLVALLGGSAVGVAMLVRGGIQARKRSIPFGPFLALGGIVALFAGRALVDAYVRGVGG